MIGRVIVTIDSHTEGEPTRIVIGGLPNIPGKTMVEKKKYFEENLDFIRRALMLEPRGHRDMFGAVITPPVSDEADFGVLWIDCSEVADMCGHGSLGVTTVAVETGMVKVTEPITKVTFDTPAGLVTGYAYVENNTVKSVSVQGVPSFLYKEVSINIEGLGEVPIKIAFGGNFFAIVNARDLGVKVSRENIQKLIKYGLAVRDRVNEEVRVQHPTIPHIKYVLGTRIIDEPTHPQAHVKNVVIFGDGQVDRSPCGTGTCAHTALLYANGEVGLNEERVHESIIGTLFRAKAVKEVNVEGYKAIIPEFSGRVYITGIHTFIIDPNDPMKYGFKVY